MNHSNLPSLLDALLAGRITRDQALSQLSGPTADLGNVQLDLDRPRRCGYPEVVFGEGKSAETLQRVIARLTAEGHEALITRVHPQVAGQLAGVLAFVRHNDIARTVRVRPENFHEQPTRGKVAIITAGTTDLPVAEEAHE